MSESEPSRGGARSAARLGAVQALYQIAQNDGTPRSVIDEFVSLRLGAEIEGDRYVAADQDMFADIVDGVCRQKEALDRRIADALAEGWRLERLELVVLATLEAGAYELETRVDVPTAVIINEYVDVAHAFFSGSEPAFVNGVLDHIAREVRAQAAGEGNGDGPAQAG